MPEPRPAHLLGAVKAVPDTCSAYRPYGQTCKPQNTVSQPYTASPRGGCVPGSIGKGDCMNKVQLILPRMLREVAHLWVVLSCWERARQRL